MPRLNVGAGHRCGPRHRGGPYPGIVVRTDKKVGTLTIKGTGSLEASCDNGAGIGCPYYDELANYGVKLDCGNIVIESGNITAKGGQSAPGIGACGNNSCGNITIKGGNVTAIGAYGPGIGCTDKGSVCGDIYLASNPFVYAPSLNASDIQTVTWNSSNVGDLDTYDEYEKAGIKLTCNRDNDNTLSSEAWYYDSGDEESGIVFQVYRPGGFTFSNTLGKKFVKIEMTPAEDVGSDEWCKAANNNQLGSGWPSGADVINATNKVTWEGNAETVDLLTDCYVFFCDPVSSIVFYLTD